MTPRALVAYASKNGSTAEIAQTIADELRRAGIDTDLVEAGDVRDLSPYTTVVLGSAVYMGRWRSEARRLLKRERRALGGVPNVWLFSSGPVGEMKPGADTGRWTVPKLVTELGPRVGMREHAVFGGRVPRNPSNFMERAMRRDTPAEVSDLRDWEEIRGWARRVAAAVAEPVPA